MRASSRISRIQPMVSKPAAASAEVRPACTGEGTGVHIKSLSPYEGRDLPPELYAYREHTTALLRRYFRLSIELGRLPSLLGREFFRARVSSYRMNTFEDGVIFVHDVERCLNRLHLDLQQVIARLVFQEYTAEEAATLLQCTRRTIVRRYMEALDSLSEAFLATGLLRAFATVGKTSNKTSTNLSACMEPIGEVRWPNAKASDLRVNPASYGISMQAAVVKENKCVSDVSHLTSSV